MNSQDQLYLRIPQALDDVQILFTGNTVLGFYALVVVFIAIVLGLIAKLVMAPHSSWLPA